MSWPFVYLRPNKKGHRTMRLGQLARKLALRPAEIVEFLAGNQILISDGSNTRLEDEHVTLIIQQFAPTRMEEVVEELKEKKEMEVFLLNEPEVNDDKQVSDEIPVLERPPEMAEIENEKPEVIKASKVELPGLKVLGKIDFPEPKKKNPEGEIPSSVESSATEEKKPIRESRKTQTKTNRREERPRKNPIALEREREAQEAEKKRRAEAEHKKELRTQHYFKKVKAPAPTKALKLMNEPVEEMPPEQTNPPRTGLGRFFRWSTT